MSKNIISEMEKSLFADGYQLGMETVGDEPSDFFTLLPATEKLYEAISQVLDSFIEYSRRNNHPPHCMKGCRYCCYQPVFASTHEVNYLLNYINSRFTPLQVDEIKTRAGEKNKKFSGLTQDDMLNAKFPCPLLSEQGSCMAYEARPVSCRIYLSFDVDSCRTFFHEPANEASIPNLIDFPLRAGRMLNEGYMAALRTRGFENREVRIEEGILRETGINL